MSNRIDNTQDLLDSRDVIARIEELEELIAGEITREEFLAYTQEHYILTTLTEQCEDYGDWAYGETLIHRNYFETYMDEMIDDCYDIPRDLPDFIILTLDYDALEQDYMSVDFDGQEYLMRC